MNRRRPNGGFTAGEFGMVLLLYMVLIASIYFSGGLRSADKARQAACMSNLKQLGMAGALYAADNTGCYPGPGSATAMNVYVKNPQAFVCPSRGRAAPQSAREGEVPPGEELLWLQLQPGALRRVDYYFAPGLHSDDRPGTIFAYDNVPDVHSGKSFNFVRLDSATGRLPADRWPGVPGQQKEAANAK